MLFEQRILVLLERCRTGDCTETERAELARWVGVDPERRAAVEAYSRALDALAAPAGASPDAAAALRRINARIDAEVSAGNRRRFNAPRILRPRDSRVWNAGLATHARRPFDGPALRVAAAIAIVAVSTITGMLLWPRPARTVEYASAPGRRVSVILRDGSHLVLGPSTRLRVAGRHVTLDGEALFTVVHDARHPFEVGTARATVRDVGTTFMVRAYAGDAEHRVAVVEGEVAVGAASLHAHDIAVIDTAGTITVRRGADVAADVSWTQGRLVFDRTPLREVARELGRMYDVDVTIADSSLERKLVKGAFTDESVDDVLRAVTFVVGARYERTGRSVVIRRAVGTTNHQAPARPARDVTASTDSHRRDTQR
ncbi:MAG TPA: FecR domain-containing protein [Gemmatimonadaceae bacterium]|nr:FecR domain-containing protein [Gemmatimonadaceae bacterium]